MRDTAREDSYPLIYLDFERTPKELASVTILQEVGVCVRKDWGGGTSASARMRRGESMICVQDDTLHISAAKYVFERLVLVLAIRCMLNAL